MGEMREGEENGMWAEGTREEMEGELVRNKGGRERRWRGIEGEKRWNRESRTVKGKRREMRGWGRG